MQSYTYRSHNFPSQPLSGSDLTPVPSPFILNYETTEYSEMFLFTITIMINVLFRLYLERLITFNHLCYTHVSLMFHLCFTHDGKFHEIITTDITYEGIFR